MSLNPSAEAIPFIESNKERYGLVWINTGRTSEDWKVRLYEQANSGLQVGIYDRKKVTLVRIEHPIDAVVVGTIKQPPPKSHAFNASFSNFQGNKGVCYEVRDVSALVGLLDRYFAPPVSPATAEEVAEQFENELKEASSRSSEERRARLAKAPRKPRQVVVQTKAYLRNADVVAEVLERASGVCELCKAAAPFIRASSGEPYLEVHHIVRLADGGEDTVVNAIALCPNCHRERHFGMASL